MKRNQVRDLGAMWRSVQANTLSCRGNKKTRAALHVVRFRPPVMVKRSDRFSSSWFPTSSHSWEKKASGTIGEPFIRRNRLQMKLRGRETLAAVLLIVKTTVWGDGNAGEGGGGWGLRRAKQNRPADTSAARRSRDAE